MRWYDQVVDYRFYVIQWVLTTCLPISAKHSPIGNPRTHLFVPPNMSDNSDTKAEAAKLKDEGNALFVKKKYREAHVKYSAAIAKDDQNAVYFANRAACSLNLKQ